MDFDLTGKDYYTILGIPPSATLKEMKAAYRRLAHQYHPDKNQGDLYAAARFDLIKEAYEILSNPARKEQYLQQRWYDQSMGKKNEETIITPVTILKKTLELDRYVSKLDVHRMDKEGLYSYICDILSDEVITKLNAFNEPGINGSIIDTVIRCSQPLPWQFTKLLSVRLAKLTTDPDTLTVIREFVHRSRQLAIWTRYKPWLLLVAAIVLCLLIYTISQ